MCILVILFLALKFLKIFEKNQKIGNFIYTFSVLLESNKSSRYFLNCFILSNYNINWKKNLLYEKRVIIFI